MIRRKFRKICFVFCRHKAKRSGSHKSLSLYFLLRLSSRTCRTGEKLLRNLVQTFNSHLTWFKKCWLYRHHRGVFFGPGVVRTYRKGESGKCLLGKRQKGRTSLKLTDKTHSIYGREHKIYNTLRFDVIHCGKTLLHTELGREAEIKSCSKCPLLGKKLEQVFSMDF